MNLNASEMNSLPSLTKFHTLVFDFDGIFTNNKVFVDQDGCEMICCDRSDGLGFNLLKKHLAINNLFLNMIIVSKEKNQVVLRRAEKLKIDCFVGVDNKLKFVKDYIHSIDTKETFDLSGVLYVGNDLNDYFIMREVGFSVAPQDAHPLIKNIATIVLPRNGGEGFLRYLIEHLIGLNNYSEENLNELIHNC